MFYLEYQHAERELYPILILGDTISYKGYGFVKGDALMTSAGEVEILSLSSYSIRVKSEIEGIYTLDSFRSIKSFLSLKSEKDLRCEPEWQYMSVRFGHKKVFQEIVPGYYRSLFECREFNPHLSDWGLERINSSVRNRLAHLEVPVV